MSKNTWIYGYCSNGTPDKGINNQVLPNQLTDEQISRIYTIQEALQEVHPQSVIKWIDGFQWDVDPEVEIQIYEAIIKVYHNLTSKARLTGPDKKRLYILLCLISMGAKKQARMVMATLPYGQLPGLGKIKQMWQGAIKDIPTKDYSAYSCWYGPGEVRRINPDDGPQGGQQ